MIEIKHLSKTFQMKDGAVNALKDINLTIPDGSIYGIIGMSGAGKSTLVRCINLLERPTEGSVVIDGTAMETLSPAALRERRRDITIIFQQFNLLPFLSVQDNVTAALTFSPVKRARLKGSPEQEARRLLAELQLPDEALHRPVHALSIGQQQRVAAARALIGSPPLVIADEPTSALDTDNRAAFIKLLFEECDKQGSTLVFVSHDPYLEPLFPRVENLQLLNRRAA